MLVMRGVTVLVVREDLMEASRMAVMEDEGADMVGEVAAEEDLEEEEEGSEVVGRHFLNVLGFFFKGLALARL